MRIMIDPDSLDMKNYVRLQAALMNSNKWTIVDRSKGFDAVKREQERLHTNNSDRFSDRQKYAHWGKLYGVGGVIVGQSQCFLKKTYWSNGNMERYCNQFVSIIDANTGVVIAAVENLVPAGTIEFASWTDTVEKFNDSYPENYQPSKKTEELELYEEESKEHALQQKAKQL